MMRNHRPNEQEVVNAYEKYENARQVSEMFGCSTETVYRILKRHGIPRTHRHPKMNKVRRSNCGTKYCPAVVRLLYAIEGYTTSEIEKLTGIPIASVCNIMRRRYPELYKSRRDAAGVADRDAIEQEYLAGASSYDLSEKYGVDHTTISKWMRKRGHCRGRGHGPNNEKAIACFLKQFPEQVDKCEKSRKRCAVRRAYRIASRPHDGSIYGLTWRDVYVHNGHSLRCWICGKPCDPKDNGDSHPSVDHIEPLSNGGTDTYDNVRIAHVGCNRIRNNKTQLTFNYLLREQR